MGMPGRWLGARAGGRRGWGCGFWGRGGGGEDLVLLQEACKRPQESPENWWVSRQVSSTGSEKDRAREAR